VQLNLRDAAARSAKAFSKKSTREFPAADFGGVENVQKMEKLDGYELILGCSVDPSVRDPCGLIWVRWDAIVEGL
jgi:hypothetical protein